MAAPHLMVMLSWSGLCFGKSCSRHTGYGWLAFSMCQHSPAAPQPQVCAGWGMRMTYSAVLRSRTCIKATGSEKIDSEQAKPPFRTGQLLPQDDPLLSKEKQRVLQCCTVVPAGAHLARTRCPGCAAARRSWSPCAAAGRPAACAPDRAASEPAANDHEIRVLLTKMCSANDGCAICGEHAAESEL